jgi:hypothetical protein
MRVLPKYSCRDFGIAESVPNVRVKRFSFANKTSDFDEMSGRAAPYGCQLRDSSVRSGSVIIARNAN